MENSDEKEVFEDCYEEKENNKEIKENKEDEKEEKNNNLNENEELENNEEDKKEKKENEYIPFTIKQAQDKMKEEEDLFKDNSKKEKEDNSESEEEEKGNLTEEEKKDIEEKIINERKNAGVLYKNGEYIQALNIYSLLLKDAKRAELKEQCCILNCNKGICFNKLNEYDKALESFKEALKYNKDYSKALCNKMLLLNKKELRKLAAKAEIKGYINLPVTCWQLS